ncbi:hypothetical protein [Halodurantibacterium flavum]|uniref:ZIP Zinc transporter n=1 Tax=Halodurantibacterium flavum TaxID=1382802 RepID=A0ABW4S3U0_9RHOB
MTETEALFLSLVVVVVLVAAHISASSLRPERWITTEAWRSLAGGVGCGYVFVFVLPELAAHQAQLTPDAPLTMREREVFLTALLGLAAYYGIEAVTRDEGPDMGPLRHRGFWVHMAGFGVYNAIVGFVLAERPANGPGEILAYGGALALHFFANDHHFMNRYDGPYQRHGRWVLSVATIGGWALGVALPGAGGVAGFLFAFLAGGMILNILKQELPSGTKSRFWAFALGVAAYAIVGVIHGR